MPSKTSSRRKPAPAADAATPARTRVRRGSEADAERLRGELLAAALAQFIEGGLEAVTMRAVATRVGVSAMTPYRYFEDKGHLLRGIWHHVLAAMTVKVREAGAGLDDAKVRTRAQINAFIDYWEANPQHYRLVYMTEQTTRTDTHGELTAVPVYAAVLEVSLENSRRLAAQVGGDAAHAKVASDIRFLMVSGYLHARLVNRRYPWSPLDTLRPAFIELIVDAMIDVLRHGPRTAPRADAPAPARLPVSRKRVKPKP